MPVAVHPGSRTRHTTWVVVAVVAAAVLAIPSAAWAAGYQDLRSPDTRDAAREAAADIDLRSPDAREATLETASIDAAAASTDLRSPDARDAGRAPVAASQPLIIQAPSTADGFHWASAAIGAGAGLLLMFAAAVGMSRRGRGPLFGGGAVNT